MEYVDKYTFIKKFFNNIIEHITVEINKSILQTKPLETISQTEIMTFKGITFLMGINKMPNLKMYWKKEIMEDKFDTKNMFIVNSTSHKRYSLIRAHFRLTHYIEKEDSFTNKIYEKTNGIVSAINKFFQSMFHQNIYA